MNKSNDRPKDKIWKAYFLLLILVWFGYLIIGLPTFTSHETDSGLAAVAGYIQLFCGAIFITVSYVIFRKVRNNQRARKIYGRVIVIVWVAILLSIVALTLLSEYNQRTYEHYQQSTELK